MPRARTATSRNQSSTRKPLTSREPVNDLTESIEDNQKMLAELMRQKEELQRRQSNRESRARKPGSERKRMVEDPFSSSESESSVRSDEGPGASAEHRMYSRFEKAGAPALKSSQRTRGSPGRKSLSKERELKSRERKNSGPRSQSPPIKRERLSDQTLQGYDALTNEEEEAFDKQCEIITTEATRKLDDVPKSARPVRNAAELRRLLEEINLSHLPRSQTKFEVWYQTQIGGVFYKEPVKSVHQSLKSAYFRLKSGTVLKFNRATSDKP